MLRPADGGGMSSLLQNGLKVGRPPPPRAKNRATRETPSRAQPLPKGLRMGEPQGLGQRQPPPPGLKEEGARVAGGGGGSDISRMPHRAQGKPTLDREAPPSTSYSRECQPSLPVPRGKNASSPLAQDDSHLTWLGPRPRNCRRKERWEALPRAAPLLRVGPAAQVGSQAAFVQKTRQQQRSPLIDPPPQPPNASLPAGKPTAPPISQRLDLPPFFGCVRTRATFTHTPKSLYMHLQLYSAVWTGKL